MIEKYTKNTRFCLICNYVSKIIPALQSRCTRFRFAPLLVPQIRGRLTDIIDNEKFVWLFVGMPHTSISISSNTKLSRSPHHTLTTLPG